ncbi:hypothetical protein CR513_03034, partial [Mucuna pruriens]
MPLHVPTPFPPTDLTLHADSTPSPPTEFLQPSCHLDRSQQVAEGYCPMEEDLPLRYPLAYFLSCMTRSSSSNLHGFDPDIDIMLYRLGKSRSNEVGNNNSLNRSIPESESVNSTFASNLTNGSNFNSDCSSSGTGSNSNFAINISQSSSNKMDNNDKTLKELATPDELKSELIHLLPKFHGLAGEDPHKHLKEFHVVCSTMRPHGIQETISR